MKHTLKTLLFLQILCCILTAAAQSQNESTENLPQNRTAFIFSNYDINASYSNPALAMLTTKSNYTPVKNTTVNTLVHYKNELTSDDICLLSNLTQDELWVQVDHKKIQDQQYIEIYDECGEMIYTTILQQALHKINVCDFTSGTFMVKLGDNVQKMIIE